MSEEPQMHPDQFDSRANRLTTIHATNAFHELRNVIGAWALKYMGVSQAFDGRNGNWNATPPVKKLLEQLLVDQNTGANQLRQVPAIVYRRIRAQIVSEVLDQCSTVKQLMNIDPDQEPPVGDVPDDWAAIQEFTPDVLPDEDVTENNDGSDDQRIDPKRPFAGGVVDPS